NYLIVNHIFLLKRGNILASARKGCCIPVQALHGKIQVNYCILWRWLMRKWLVFVLLFGLAVFPSHANAQGVTKLDSVNIGLWSEYDQPSVLVLNEFVVSKDTSLPTTVTMRFPKGANLIAVAVNENGSLINTNFDGPTEQENWQAITLNVQS